MQVLTKANGTYPWLSRYLQEREIEGTNDYLLLAFSLHRQRPRELFPSFGARRYLVSRKLLHLNLLL